MAQTYDDYENWEDEGQDSPLALVGILVMALTSAAIVANALFMQPKSAEIELINQASRQQVTEPATSAIANIARGNAQQSANGQVSQSAVPGVSTQALQSDKVALVLAIQRQLTLAGYYVGPLDGQEGAQTREAISAYQDAMGMETTGHADIAFYNALTGKGDAYGKPVTTIQDLATGGATTQAAQSQQSNARSTLAALPKIKPAEPVQRSSSSQTSAPRQRLAVTAPKPQPQVRLTQDVGNSAMLRQMASGPVPPADIPSSPQADPTLAKVQSALKQNGYGNLTVDGLMGNNTRAAISAFQRSRGHPVTGAVNDRLLQELMVMGYLDLG